MTNLARIRKELLQITQVDLAAICEVAQSTVSRWERGIEEPSQSHIQRILDWAAKEGRPLTPADFFAQPGAAATASNTIPTQRGAAA